MDAASHRDAPRLHERSRFHDEAQRFEYDQKHGQHNRYNRKRGGSSVEIELLNEDRPERRANHIANAEHEIENHKPIEGV